MTDSPDAGPSGGRRGATAARRRARTQEILSATRALFDERGLRDAQMEDVAKAVGINRAIVYRHFSGKEELFALTVVNYLEELRAALLEAEAATTSQDPEKRLTALVEAFTDYGVRYPAFVECAQSLMRLSGPELLEEVSDDAALRLGRAISGCLSVVVAVLEDGVRAGVFHIENPDVLANTLYASGLGALQLARVGILVRESSPGIPSVATITPEQVRDYLVASALAVATRRSAEL